MTRQRPNKTRCADCDQVFRPSRPMITVCPTCVEQWENTLHGKVGE